MTTSQHHKKILVIRHGALGDIIFTLGCMAAIRNHHQDADEKSMGITSKITP